MKIVYLHQYFKTPQTNGGTRSYEMARRWVARGHRVHMVTSDSERSTGGWRTYEVEGITVHACAVPYSNSMSFGRRIQAFFQFGVRASFRARRLKGDVVFATSTPLTIIVPALFATAFRRTPMVFEVRDLWPDVPIALGVLTNPLMQRAARTLEWIAYHSADAVVALSPGMAEGIRNRGIGASRIVVAPNSCDNEDFNIPNAIGIAYRESQPWLKDRPLVVYCGTLGKVNNIRYMVDVAAATRLLESSIAFAIYGTGAEEQLVRERADSLGLLNTTLFMPGAVTKKELPDILSAADVCTSFVLPVKELEYNSANKFFDALAAGRTMAVNHYGWQAELLEASGAGLVLDPKDPYKAARALIDFLRDPGRVSRARDAARLLADQQFARDLLSDRVLETLVAVKSRRRKPTKDPTTERRSRKPRRSATGASRDHVAQSSV